jgi:hypothetical protein
MMGGTRWGLGRHPIARLGLLAAVLALSIGAARAVYIGPREREAGALEARAARLSAKLEDLQRGIGDLAAWSRAHPGATAGAPQGRLAPPTRVFVSEFLRALEPVAARHGIVTESIEPIGHAAEEVVSDATGTPVRLVRQSLRFRVRGTYRDLAEYVSDVDAMGALVVTRSVALGFDGGTYPALGAEVRFDLYGTP